MAVGLTIDNIDIEVEEGLSVLEAASRAGIYIPTICHHPDVPPFDIEGGSPSAYQGAVRNEGSPEAYGGCQLCLVHIDGIGITTSCNTAVHQGMRVETKTPEVKEERQENLRKILAKHPHACLVCPQHEGCDLKQCISNVPTEERCCSEFPTCELRKVSEYIGMRVDVPPYVPRRLTAVEEEPLFKRDYNLCIGCTRCVRVCNEVRGVGSLTFTSVDGQVVVGTTAPTLEDSGCKFCGACVEVCPTGAIMDKAAVAADRETYLVPCKHTCPAGVDVPRYVRLIAEGKFSEAAAVVRERVPFPATLGRVCFHPCETVCRRAELDEPLSIKELKRCALEHDTGLRRHRDQIAPETGKRVAIIGSGPAGMTCGYYLAKVGHTVTIFESLPEPGGLLRYGIPEYRLPRHILDLDIEEIRKVGVEIKTNTKVESLDACFEAGFDAVFLAAGLSKSMRLGIDGDDCPGVIDGVSLLRGRHLGSHEELGERVAVIGGGNVAVDAARTALRTGSGEVCILYRRSFEEMPAHEEEVTQAQEEGITYQCQVAPIGISQKDGTLSVQCLRMELAEPDGSGRRRPIPIVGSEFEMTFDNVVVAVGQSRGVPEDFDSLLGPEGYSDVKANTLDTSRKGVFVGGDLASGPSTVIDAIAAGRKGAMAIDRFLGGKGIIEERLAEADEVNACLGKEHGFASLKRVPANPLRPEERNVNFEEVMRGYTREEAIQEARRCLRCDLRLRFSSVEPPPEEWIEFSVENIDQLRGIDGVFRLFDDDGNVILIKGAMNLYEEMEPLLNSYDKARYFTWEEEPLFSKRESELLEQFMQEHGGLPEGNAGLDDDLY